MTHRVSFCSNALLFVCAHKTTIQSTKYERKERDAIEDKIQVGSTILHRTKRERARRTKASADDTKRNEREDIFSLGISKD